MTALVSNNAISDENTHHPQVDGDVIMFDGHCNLCNGWVQWVLKRDKKGRYKFASLQSEIGQKLIIDSGRDPDSFDSVVLWRNNHIWIKSEAALRIASGLGGIYKLAMIFMAVPGIVRNAVYDWIARNRYRWFGRSEECLLPKPEWRNRFLDNSDT
ncbi:MAG: thiol-disulfide oxidoreductase DCC family protein [Bacteroidota bacterium]